MEQNKVLAIFYEVAKWNDQFGNKQNMLSSEGTEVLLSNEIAMLQEEYDEYVKAKDQNDTIEILDALLDVAFVVAGTAHKIQIKNFDPMNQSDESLKWIQSSEDYVWQINAHIEELSKRMHAQRWDQCSNPICQIFHKSILMADQLTDGKGFEAMKEVIRSNFTKFPMRKNENGKIQKSENFEKPELEQFLAS